MKLDVSFNVAPTKLIVSRTKAVNAIVRKWQRNWPRDAAEKVRQMLIERILAGNFSPSLASGYRAYRDKYRAKRGLKPAKFWQFSDRMINSIGSKKESVGVYIAGLVNNTDMGLVSYVWDNEQIRPLYKPTFKAFLDSNPFPKKEFLAEINRAWRGK